ncbi:MAG TPA: S8 family serine peptidase [Ilumatobacter sp.]
MNELENEAIDAAMARPLGGHRARCRRGRVWKAPHPVYPPIAERVAARPARSRWGAYPVMLATLTLIAAGAISLARLDDGPAPATVPVTPAVADLPLGSMYRIVDQIDARPLWEAGVTGRGVSVAVIDTGVAAVSELTGPDKLVAAVDLSSEQSDPMAAFGDSYGHGTHLAGIIAGRQVGADPALAADHPEWFLGVAPDAGIVSVKVAGRDGRVSPAALISGIDWVIEHAGELDVRVVTLALGIEDATPELRAAVSAALERAWQAGIVVVVAAGNGGAESAGLAAPATNPYVIAVGGLEAGPEGLTTAPWASAGDADRRPDVAAPGAHVESLRAPGSYADVEHPEGYVDRQRFLASGSSQSAAVVSGAIALLLAADPSLTPDQVKGALVASAADVVGASTDRVGAGAVSVAAAAAADPADAPVQTWEPATSDIELAPVAGLVAVFDGPAGVWLSSTWLSSTWLSSTWLSSTWLSSTWLSSTWLSSTWLSSTWLSSTWLSSTWS